MSEHTDDSSEEGKAPKAAGGRGLLSRSPSRTRRRALATRGVVDVVVTVVVVLDTYTVVVGAVDVTCGAVLVTGV